MTFIILALIITLPIVFVICILAFLLGPSDEWRLPLIGIICAPIAFIILSSNPKVQQIVKEQEAYQSQPHLYSKEGDCEVYEFKGHDGHYHYFTKCANSKTTTTTTIQEGKSSRQEEITTQ